MHPALTVGYLTLFTGAAVAVVFGGLLIGRLLRPHRPTPEKLQTYECGEPAVGPADVQFDLRFYVIALVFLIFDVEVAVFFPWAVVFGKATHLQSATSSEEGLKARLGELGFGIGPAARASAVGTQSVSEPAARSPETREGSTNVSRPAVAKGSESLPRVRGEISSTIHSFGRSLAWMAFIDVAVFFAILLVGFAYLWHRGDLAWVRALPEGSRTSDVQPAILRERTEPAEVA